MNQNYVTYMSLKSQREQLTTDISIIEQQKVQIANNFAFSDYFVEQPSLETIEIQQLELIYQRNELTESIQLLLQQLPSTIHLGAGEIVDLENTLITLSPILDACIRNIDTLLENIQQSRQKIDAGRLSELGDLLIERRNGTDGGSSVASLIADGLSSFLASRGAASTEDINTQTADLQNLLTNLEQLIHQATHIQESLLKGIQQTPNMQLQQITGGKLTTIVEILDVTQDYTQVFQKLFPRLQRTIDRASIASFLLQSSLKSQTTTLRDQLVHLRTWCTTLQQQSASLTQDIGRYRATTGQTHP